MLFVKPQIFNYILYLKKLSDPLIEAVEIIVKPVLNGTWVDGNPVHNGKRSQSCGYLI
jgi:hypothetical protein